MPAAEPKSSKLLIALFAVYLLLLAWLILWKLDVPYVGAAAGLARPIKLIPFLPDANSESSAPLEVLVNVLLFVPFEFMFGLLVPKWSWWKVAAVALVLSLVFETAQHVLSIGTFDTSDLISNTLGGLAGFGLLALLRRRFGARPLVRACTVFAVMAVVATLAFVASPLHYSQPHDVIFPSPRP